MSLNDTLNKLLSEIVEKNVHIEDYTYWYDMGLDSLKYIRFIVDIESEFDIIIDDDMLVYNRNEKINSMLVYLQNVLK